MPAYGRGGAGNIQAVDQQNDRIVKDLEANESNAKSLTQTLSSDTVKRDESQYAYTGRGGSGNFYSRKDVSQAKTSGLSDVAASEMIKSTRTSGRGGVGNYEFSANESAQTALKKDTRDEQVKERLTKDIEKEVNEELAMPPKARTTMPKLSDEDLV